MQFLTEWWGVNENIAPLEVAARAAAMFLAMLLMLRFTGMRSFGKGSVFDNVIIILLGAVLGRGVIGASPFFSALTGGIVLLLVHKVLSQLTFYNRWAGRHIKGSATLLFKNGEFFRSNMAETDITENDILEDLRITCQAKDLSEIDEVYLERTGKLSFVRKKEFRGLE